jgi:UrcA family protein
MPKLYRDTVHVVALALIAVLTVSPIETLKAAALHAGTTSVTVRFHSGDLTTPRGVAGLYRRIRVAAEAVCGQPDHALVPEKLLWEQCVDQAMAVAVAKVRSETLSDYRMHQLHGRERMLQQTRVSLAVREPAVP